MTTTQRHYRRMTKAERMKRRAARAAAAFACWLVLASVAMTAAALASYYINH